MEAKAKKDKAAAEKKAAAERKAAARRGVAVGQSTNLANNAPSSDNIHNSTPSGPSAFSAPRVPQLVPTIPTVATPAPPTHTVPAPSTGEENPENEPETADTPFNLHPDDPQNFLKLSGALTLLGKHQIWESEIVESDLLLRDYCTELITVRHQSVNYFFTHRSFSSSCTGKPVSNLTTTTLLTSPTVFVILGLSMHSGHFSLNASTKCSNLSKPTTTATANSKPHSFKNSNEHVNYHVWYIVSGPLENEWLTTFLDLQTYSLSGYPSNSLPSQFSSIMLKASNEDRGTVADLATLSRDLEEVNADGKNTLVP